MNAAGTQTEKDVRPRRDMLISGTGEKNGGPGESPGTKTAVQVRGEPAIQADDLPVSRVSGEASANAGKGQAPDPAMSGSRNGAVAAPDNLLHGKPSLGAEAVSADGETAPGRVEIVVAVEQGGGKSGPTEASSRKSQEGKSADAAPNAAPAQAAADLRSGGESRSAAPLPETRSQSAEQIINQVREKLDANGRAGDSGQITMKLHPQELGELKINMRMDDHSLKVEIVTQNPSVKEALMQNIDTLKETLSRQNIAMERFEVTADARQWSNQSGRDERETARANAGFNGTSRQAAEREDEVTPAAVYRWDSENSLVNLIL